MTNEQNAAWNSARLVKQAMRGNVDLLMCSLSAEQFMTIARNEEELEQLKRSVREQEQNVSQLVAGPPVLPDALRWKDTVEVA